MLAAVLLAGFYAILACGLWERIRNVEELRAIIRSTGAWAPLVFILIQALQVFLLPIPGLLTVGAGVLIFGPAWGFVYNYVGISIGSVLAFLLSKRYGKPFVRNMIGEKNYDKYIGWLNKGNAFDKAFAAAIFFPVAPDDLLCYIAGLTKMSLKKFTLIIILGKPGSIFLYSLGLTSITRLLQYFF